jgi:hypothetical protein
LNFRGIRSKAWYEALALSDWTAIYNQAKTTSMVTIRPAIKWVQALAALLLLAVGPVVEPARTQDGALGQVFSGDPSKAIALKRQQLGSTNTAPQPERFDNNGHPKATLAGAAEPMQLWVRVVDRPKIDSPVRRSPRFCGASPRAPPSA